MEMEKKYRVVHINTAEIEETFNQLASEGYGFLSFAQNFGTHPAGAEVIALFGRTDDLPISKALAFLNDLKESIRLPGFSDFIGPSGKISHES